MGETRKLTKKQEIIAYKLSKIEKKGRIKKPKLKQINFGRGIYKFSAIIFAVHFRFSLCYTKPTEKANIFRGNKKTKKRDIFAAENISFI